MKHLVQKEYTSRKENEAFWPLKIVQLSGGKCRQQSRHGEEIQEVQQLSWASMHNNGSSLMLPTITRHKKITMMKWLVRTGFHCYIKYLFCCSNSNH